MKKIWRTIGLTIMAFFFTATLALAANISNTNTPPVTAAPNSPQISQDYNPPQFQLIPAQISVIEPKSSSYYVSWNYYTDCMIKWEYKGYKNGKKLGGNVTIKLFKQNGSFVRNIAVNVSIGNDGKGSYPWHLLTTDLPQTCEWYQILIQSQTYGDVKVMSEAFAINNQMP